MPRRHQWTTESRELARSLRFDQRLGWELIGARLGVTKQTVIDQFRRLGWSVEKLAEPAADQPSMKEPDRDPLPAGDSVTWGAITAGTVLEGAAYG